LFEGAAPKDQEEKKLARRETLPTLVDKETAAKILKDFMWRFGNFITNKMFLKAFTFIIGMGILLTTTLATYSVFQLMNIGRILRDEMLKRWKNIFPRLDRWLLNGTGQKKEESDTLKKRDLAGCLGETLKNLNYLVEFAAKTLMPIKSQQPDVRKLAETEKSTCKEMVYNLTVKEAGVYYANGVLVSNCDAEQGLVQLLQFPKAPSKAAIPEDNFRWWQKQRVQQKEKPKHSLGIFSMKNKPIPQIPHRVSWK
jgi:hypothetical protein